VNKLFLKIVFFFSMSMVFSFNNKINLSNDIKFENLIQFKLINEKGQESSYKISKIESNFLIECTNIKKQTNIHIVIDIYGRPQSYQEFTINSNKIILNVKYNYINNQIVMSREENGTKSNKTINSSDLFEAESLWIILYSLIKNNNNFDCQIFDHNNKRLLQERFKLVGKEMIKSEGVDIECYKIEMSLTGFLAAFWPYKYYYYYSVKNENKFIRYEGKGADGGVESFDVVEYRIY